MAGDTQEPWAIVRAKLSLAKTNPIAESHHYSQSSPASGSKRKVFYENIPALTIPSCWLFSSKQQNRPSDSGKNRAEATKKMAGSFFWKSGEWHHDISDILFYRHEAGCFSSPSAEWSWLTGEQKIYNSLPDVPSDTYRRQQFQQFDPLGPILKIIKVANCTVKNALKMHKNHKSAVVTGSLGPEGPQIGASSNRFTPDRLLTKAVMDMATSGPLFADDLPSRNGID